MKIGRTLLWGSWMLLAACDWDEPLPYSFFVEVVPDSVNLAVGDSLRFFIVGTGAHDPRASIRWASSDTSVAGVAPRTGKESEAMVTARAPGTAVITVVTTADSKRAESRGTVRVSAP